MKPYFRDYTVNNFLNDLADGLTSTLADKGLLAIALATSGFMRVLMQDSDVTADFAYITIIAFALMTMLGLVKHIKNKERDAKVFLIKTATQFTVMVSVIVLGYLFAIAVFGVRTIASRVGIVDVPTGPIIGMYFIYSGYMITFTYHSLKSLDLIEQILPNYVPAWFSATFRRFRKTGEFADLLKTPPEVTDEKKDTKPAP